MKKTRAEKIATAEKRQQTMHAYSYSSTPVPSKQSHIISQKSHTQMYVARDLQKTAIVSVALIAAELLLFFLLQHHIVKIPGVSY